MDEGAKPAEEEAMLVDCPYCEGDPDAHDTQACELCRPSGYCVICKNKGRVTQAEADAYWAERDGPPGETRIPPMVFPPPTCRR